ncbi:Bin3 family protein [Westerdykella ornata]|uniref:RNA methyltransferase n=1 Tax=Westerdykella ornata TaxID=318751 RepID=A0A6A6JMI0_WESOR|nr:Bin3 family protein [Westerdykella ornata]KAF2277702.1 Bin3 family protein [Westerdykella ornata]
MQAIIAFPTDIQSTRKGFDFAAASVTGVDIDPELVQQAENSFALRASRVRPATSDSERIVDYFPISVVLEHGYRFEPRTNIASQQDSELATFPEWPRVSFFSGDWVTSANRATEGPYDVILALSVIKWIHLEHGDDGLVTFFRKCASSLAPGGYLVIELQPWKSYERAVRPGVAPHFMESFRKLKYRPETSFSALLQEHGLHLCNESDALPRRISVYHKA